MMPPKFLYKYQAFNDHSWENLTDRQIWFSKPAILNDPYDCAIRPGILPATDHEWVLVFLRARNIIERYKSADAVALFEKMYYPNQQPNQAFKDFITSEMEQFYRLATHGFNPDSGVACFSEVNRDLLMWSHYARAHTGFCEEFDTSFDLFRYAFQVQYRAEIPSVSPSDIALNRESLWKNMLGTKAECWAYEKEWRILSRIGNQAYLLDPGCIIGIYFGLRAEPSNRARAIATFRGTSVKFYDMVKDETMFRLETRPASTRR